MSKLILKYTLIAILGVAFGSNLALAQFGKNKVQYQNFNWKYIQSKHFDIYYNEGSKYLGEFAAISAEKALLSIQSTLNYKLTMRVVIVVYDSHNEFQQTNVVSSFMPEGVGGVTELFKNRVVVPFQGDYGQFRHVIHHELVHAIVNDMFYGGTLQSALSTSGGFMIPLWINEGLCEFESLGGMNVETDMFMRDLTISEQLPSLNRLNGYLAYRGGQTFFWYVAEKYGRGRVTDFMNKLRIYRNVEQTFLAKFNMKLRDFSEMWERDIKRIYWPDLSIYEDPRDFATKITDRRDIGNFYNTSPAISPNGEKMAFISDSDGLFGIYIQELDANKPARRLVSSLRKKDFEDLNILTPGISWDPTGKKIAISAKAGGEDAIFIVDERTGRYDRLTFGIPSITSVNWSPDGKHLAFVGSRREQSDIYIYELSNKKLTQATNDVFSIKQIAWATDGKSIFFVSDRADVTEFNANSSSVRMWLHNFEASDIFRVYLGTPAIERITFDSDFQKTSIAVSSDGTKLLYVSDKSGIGNIYLKDLETGSERALTNSISGIAQLSLSPDDGKLLFSAQAQGGYDIYLLRLPFNQFINKEPVPTALRKRQQDQAKIVENLKNELNADTTEEQEIIGYGDFQIDFSNQQLVEPNPDVMRSVSSDLERAVKGKELENTTFIENDYTISFSPDIILVNPGYSNYYGFQSMTQMLFSDVLGDHQIYVGANLLYDLKNSQFYFAYNYLPDLIDYQISAYHTAAYTSRFTGDINRFRNYGLGVLASYPFDLFTRVEWGVNFIGASMENITRPTDPAETRFLFVPEGRFVFDNALGGWYAPTKGMRAYIEFLGSPKFNKNSIGFMTVKSDVRQYITFFDYLTLAIRGSFGASFGPEPQKFYIGGAENWLNSRFKDNRLPFDSPEDYIFLQNFIMPMRGWSIAELTGNKFFISNVELRFPLFTALVAGPVPILLQGVMGAFFFDVGGAWNNKFVISKVDVFGNRVPENLLMSAGVGARTYLFGMPIKMDVAWRNEYSGWSKPNYIFSIGFDF